MATNSYFNHQSNTLAQTMAENLYIESIQHRGVDLTYVQRTRVNSDDFMGESSISTFSDNIVLEMYIADVTTFNGDGDLFSKFGFQMNDTMEVEMSTKRFKEEADLVAGVTIDEPQNGDLIYVPFSDSLWEITKVKRDRNYYQNGSNIKWILMLQLFEYSHEEFSTGIPGIDDIGDVSVAGMVSGLDTALGITGDDEWDDTDEAIEAVADSVDVTDPQNPVRNDDGLLDDAVFDPTRDLL